jgi:hypothetical protein
MTGFRTVRAWAESEADGRSWLSFFRKVPPSTATIAGQWFDYSTASGVPVPNYYASSPLVAATLEAREGIYVPEQTGTRWLKSTTVMSAAASATATTNQKQPLMLLDYLLYYPFIDLDAAGDEQATDNTVTLPRYDDGEGVRAMVVAQAPTVGGGTFTVNYTDSDGTDRTSATVFCAAAQPSGALVAAVTAAAGVTPFLPVAAGVRGIRRINSVTVGVANGGLAAIVLVRPLEMSYAREECRRPTSSPAESFGDAAQIERVRMRAGSQELKAGAFLGFIGMGVAGSLASAPLVGMIESFWSA